MSLTRPTSIWDIVSRPSTIDPDDLLEAIRAESASEKIDTRTKLLLRDSIAALRQKLGERQIDERLGKQALLRLSRILHDVPADFGFPSICERLMPSTRLDTVQQFLRELGEAIPSPAQIDICGSVALTFAGLLDRRTEDIDVVDEIPVQLRGEHALLDSLAARYGLRLTHFQSHYLPDGWETRAIDRGNFGRLQARTVDPLDIFVGELFSSRAKDRDDLRALQTVLKKSEIIERLATSASRLSAEANLADHASKNWYIVFGETYPVRST